eukprot:UC1_evm1s1884
MSRKDTFLSLEPSAAAMTVILCALILTAAASTAAAAHGDESPYLINPCLSSPYKEMDFCNTSLGVTARVEAAIARMSLPEKISAMGSKTPDIKSLGLPSYNWWSEATHGISHVRNTDATPGETNFALPITTAASFNRSLWWATGQQIGVEARAFMNAGNAYSTYW